MKDRIDFLIDRLQPNILPKDRGDFKNLLSIAKDLDDGEVLTADEIIEGIGVLLDA